MLSTGIVGAGIPVAVGLALAAREQKSDRVVAVTFGDGATNTGSFHEGANLASTWQLPVILVCQNNGYAEMTPTADTMHVEHIADRAVAYDMPGVAVDGNDPVAVYAGCPTPSNRARPGGGPTLECVTFRLIGHYLRRPEAVHAFGGARRRRMRHDPVPLFPDPWAKPGVAPLRRGSSSHRTAIRGAGR